MRACVRVCVCVHVCMCARVWVGTVVDLRARVALRAVVLPIRVARLALRTWATPCMCLCVGSFVFVFAGHVQSCCGC